MSTNAHFEHVLVYKTFMPLQVLTSCLVYAFYYCCYYYFILIFILIFNRAFAHGANDVSNAVGPFAAILSVYREHTVPDKVTTPMWLLACGGGTLIYFILNSITYLFA